MSMSESREEELDKNYKKKEAGKNRKQKNQARKSRE
jgi:hypothetical protein